MANIASAKKRILVSSKKQLSNQILVSKVKTSLKKFDTAIKTGNVELATTLFPATIGLIDNITHKGIWHINKSARKKSALAIKLNNLKNSAETEAK